VLRVKVVFFDALIYLLNNYRPFASLREDSLLNFDRQGYKAIFGEKEGDSSGEREEWRAFAEQLVETMIFTRLCEYHLYEEKILRWNQSNLGGLFVYCQNILADKCPSGFWGLPPKRKTSWQW
jgi:hypothetical protein